MSSWMLHISDPHLGDVPGKLDDDKEIIKDQPDLETSQGVFLRTLATMAEFAVTHGKPQYVLVSGDLTYRNRESGFQEFRKLLESNPKILPEERSRIVVVPGNHDVAWDARPASKDRYARFLEVTRELGCTTPLLDGIDFDEGTAALKGHTAKHSHVLATDEVIVIPLNSSNFCGVPVTPRGAWTEEDWRRELKKHGLGADPDLRDQLKKLHQEDIARISKPQIQALAARFAKLGLDTSPQGDDRLRIAVLHHQLLPLSTREERKAFESLVSLQMLRQMLRDYGVRLVLHGHKHESALYWHSVGDDGEDLSRPPHRMLVVSSPGRFEAKAPTMRAIMLEGSPLARNARIFTVGGATPSRKHPDVLREQTVGIWQAEMEGEQRPPTVIAAENTHSGYARLRSLFALEGEKTRPHVVCEIEDPSDAAVLPPDYPEVPAPDRDQWLAELVAWWQLDRSELLRKALAPFTTSGSWWTGRDSLGTERRRGASAPISSYLDCSSTLGRLRV